MKYISLGGGCDVAMITKYLGKRDESYPFDWLWNLKPSSLLDVCEIIGNDFRQVLEIDCYMKAKHYRFPQEVLVYRDFPHIVHLHSNPLDDNKDHKTLVRRFLRLQKILIQNDDICFIYYQSHDENCLFGRNQLSDNVYNMIIQGIYFVNFFQNKFKGKIFSIKLIYQVSSNEDYYLCNNLLSNYSTLIDKKIKIFCSFHRDDQNLQIKNIWASQMIEIVSK
jgi:hypothetical protein